MDSMITEKKDYIIEFERKSLSLFNTDNNYFCIIRIKNILGNIIKELCFKKEDIFILLDNIYCDIEFSNGVYCSFTNYNSQFMETIIISFNIENTDYSYRQYMSIYTFSNEDMNIICKIEMNEMNELINKLYYNFLYESNIEHIGVYEPNNFI